MFDPSVYENVKVVVEGAIYDLDLEGRIQITDRKDIVDLATLSRTYELVFHAVGSADIDVHFTLIADLASFADEKINQDSTVGCEVVLTFSKAVKEENRPMMAEAIRTVWEERPRIKQKVIYTYPEDSKLPVIENILTFDRKITEAQLSDVPAILEHCMKTIYALKRG